jgi:hypothetical protein
MARTDKDKPLRLVDFTPKYGYHKKTSRLMRSKFRCGGASCKCLLDTNTRAKEKSVWRKELSLV